MNFLEIESAIPEPVLAAIAATDGPKFEPVGILTGGQTLSLSWRLLHDAKKKGAIKYDNTLANLFDTFKRIYWRPSTSGKNARAATFEIGRPPNGEV
jgi:hypothetical protein